MLVTKLAFTESNDYLSDRMRKAYDFLATADLANLPLGRVDIDGDQVYANVCEYATVPASERDMEAHRLYYDVQFVVSGEEVLQYAPVEGLAATTGFDVASDYGLYEAPSPCSCIVMRSGDMAVLAPEDAHKPGCQLAGPCKVRKVIVKVHI